jgi:hypothetical protein
MGTHENSGMRNYIYKTMPGWVRWIMHGMYVFIMVKIAFLGDMLINWEKSEFAKFRVE